MEDSDVTTKPVCLLIQITMWDLANGKLLRTITDAHPPGTAILHVKVQSYTHTNTRVCVLAFGTVRLTSPPCWTSSRSSRMIRLSRCATTAEDPFSNLPSGKWRETPGGWTSVDTVNCTTVYSCFSLLSGGSWECAPATLAVSSAALKERSAVSSRSAPP